MAEYSDYVQDIVKTKKVKTEVYMFVNSLCNVGAFIRLFWVHRSSSAANEGGD